jgi:hypothetical protein
MPVGVQASGRRPQPRWLWLAAAAGLLLTLGVAGARWLARGEPAEQRYAHGPAPLLAPSPNLQSMVPHTPVKVEETPAPPPVLPRRMGTSNLKRAQRAVPAVPGPVGKPALVPVEYVTEFYPMTGGGELIPLDGGQIVRVQMPRANLIPLGIPVNQERAADTVKADVLVSHDGLARAIRLVY